MADDDTDYEDMCEAETIEDASEIFTSKINKLSSRIDPENDKVYGGDWNAKDIIKYVREYAE